MLRFHGSGAIRIVAVLGVVRVDDGEEEAIIVILR